MKHLLQFSKLCLRLCCILKVYCFNYATNIVEVINTLKIMIFMPQNLFDIPRVITWKRTLDI